ncbi:MAG: NAD-dependent epimerase/dehydratase family protein, partial [Rhodocyclaceae bacterium]|nr:NAD-dependent epimerase/dehydratase family protein [Rhodocyclaceae bacterium]
LRRFSETVVADLLDEKALARACEGVDAIIHCAGPAPFFDEDDGVAVHRRMDEHLEGTRKLLAAAVAAGVRRFIHLSSVRAVGRPGLSEVDESWVAAPDSLFGQGKLSIEHRLLSTMRQTGMAAVNLRLAPVYGHGCGGDIGWLINAVRAGWMPPLPETKGRHSIVHVSDVIDAVYTVLTDTRADGCTYIVAHAVSHSGAEIFDAVRAALGRKPARWRVSDRWLHRAGRWGDGLQRLLRQPMPLNSELVARLLEVECYSPARIREELGWEAHVGLTTGLRDCIRTRG